MVEWVGMLILAKGSFQLTINSLKQLIVNKRIKTLDAVLVIVGKILLLVSEILLRKLTNRLTLKNGWKSM